MSGLKFGGDKQTPLRPIMRPSLHRLLLTELNSHLQRHLMLSWFTEDATLPFISGMVLAVVFFLLFASSRAKPMLYLSIVAALLAGGIFACEQMIVTEREEIVAIVGDLATQVKTNNVAGVVKHLSPQHQNTIDRASNEMPKYNFSMCNLSGISDFKEDQANPNVKVISFVANFRASIRPHKEMIPGQRKVTLTFERDSTGQWKVIDYSHSNPRKKVRL